SGVEESTTNNRMELMAVIEGLSALKEPCEVDVYSDSAYVINAFQEKWLESWQLNNWKTAGKKPVKNVDLWQKLLDFLSYHKISWNKVKGHADNEFNNRCDFLATNEIAKFKNV
ncbi:MAG: ribonuclease HI, partial [Clostridia bacterium]|nr:ribonuclease HI [Clostridia bacterium]